MDSLDKFTNDAWQLDNSEWVKNRKKQWDKLEPVLKDHAKPTKFALTPIKNYFLKGALPNWKKYQDWDSVHSTYRHLDLFTFLWLYPSQNEADMKCLFEIYMNSKFPLNEDVSAGYSLFFEFLDSCAHNTNFKKPIYLYIDEKDVQTIFKAMFLGQRKRSGKTVGNEEISEYQYSRMWFWNLRGAIDWISIKESQFKPFRAIYWVRFDPALEWWIENMTMVAVEDIEFSRDVRVVEKDNVADFFRKFLSIRKNSIFSEIQLELYNKLLAVFESEDLPLELRKVWLEIKNIEMS